VPRLPGDELAERERGRCGHDALDIRFQQARKGPS
jgi:hypothetical protein